MFIVLALIIFCFLIFIHEGGHFLAAKFFKVGVKEFSLGMGPGIFSRKKGETVYSLRILPIGGYCSMLESPDEISGDSEGGEVDHSFDGKISFSECSTLGKAVILCAGAFMNLLCAILITIGMVLYVGLPTTTIDQVQPASPAVEAGIKAGDRIENINGVAIENWSQIKVLIAEGKGSEVSVGVNRDGKELNFRMKPVISEDGSRLIIGITPERSRNILTASKLGVENTWQMGGVMLDVIRQLITGETSPKQLTGVIGITVVVEDSIHRGVLYVCYVASMLSLNLAVVNMLPFPALDGGRVLMLFVRKLAGKRISDAIESKIHFVGILLLFSLMIFVTWQDIERFIIN